MFRFIHNSVLLCTLYEFIGTRSTWVRGLGVGRSPPPGRRPATALAGANRDKALVSSGITPAEKHPCIRTHFFARQKTHKNTQKKSPWYTTWVCWKYLCSLKYKAWLLWLFIINFMSEWNFNVWKFVSFFSTNG